MRPRLRSSCKFRNLTSFSTDFKTLEAKRVAVGLSGGVDSAVAAFLLKQQGHDVHGIFMKNWDEDDGTEYCTAVEDFEDAQRIADLLDIPLHSINFASEYWDDVFEDFLTEYKAGRTPNPDVLCNQHIKFAVFHDYVTLNGFENIATGHYARLKRNNGSVELHRGYDLSKDQTYFLQTVPFQRFENCLFPLENLEKTEVRRLAKQNNLPVFDKKDSTGICFIGERRFSDFLSRYVQQDPGPIVDMQGETIGEHIGLPFYTLGQRQGLKIGGLKHAREAPWYVQAKCLNSNELVVTQEVNDLMAQSLRASHLNALTASRDVPERCEGMVRYRATPQPCTVNSNGSFVDVRFDQPQRAITPGQFVAFFNESRCLGGAKIESVNA